MQLNIFKVYLVCSPQPALFSHVWVFYAQAFFERFPLSFEAINSFWRPFELRHGGHFAAGNLDNYRSAKLSCVANIDNPLQLQWHRPQRYRTLFICRFWDIVSFWAISQASSHMTPRIPTMVLRNSIIMDGAGAGALQYCSSSSADIGDYIFFDFQFSSLLIYWFTDVFDIAIVRA